MLSVGGLVATVFFLERSNPDRFYYIAIIGVIVTASISLTVLPTNLNTVWAQKSDKSVYQYYASSLALHGTNPYTANMVPALARSATIPTVLANGTIENAYNYPAFSLVPTMLALLILHNTSNFYPFILIMAIMGVTAALCVYYKSNYNISLLLPITALIFTNYLVSAINAYLAVTFLFFAYMLRRRTSVYGLLLGLAASTHQLAWVAIPFFLVLVLREEGKRQTTSSDAPYLLQFLY